MDKNLEQQIEERKKQALTKGFVDKGRTIAENLGYGGRKTYADADGGGDIEYADFNFGNDKVKITYLFGEVTITDHAQQKIVFDGTFGDTIRTYIPGNWETEIEELHKQALARTKELSEQENLRKKSEEEQKEAQERAKWGL